MAGAVLRARRGPEGDLHFPIAVEVVDDELGVVGAGADVRPEVEPEQAGAVEFQRVDEDVARDAGLRVVLGVVRRTSSGSFNSSRFYSADGKLEANYDKRHLIPGVEPEKAGDKRITLDQSSGRWGLQICKDMDFPKLSREYAGEGANLLLVPAWTLLSIDGCTHAWP